MAPIEFSSAKALVFRITHRDNVTKILEGGCPCRTNILAQSGYAEMETRKNRGGGSGDFMMPAEFSVWADVALRLTVCGAR